jgi:F0F1-type ATP synthase membrane subunit b/b'
MAKDRKDHSDRGGSEAKSKLSRLLETENELEAMLKEARREAKGLVETAGATADERVRQFELQLEGENRDLGKRIAGDRDHAIDSLRKEAQEEAQRLDALDDTKITELARYVVDLLVGRTDTRGPR